ncbi:aspartyl-phosphate phosphatase Spo0E family protein [Neobacillus niacini]|uniref:aspartyl-phosphate phosphatase Spo0E family protein n=1 Tax=Neobacillus niacini TaxID=86668 RepID=UPI002FFDC43A
MVTALKKETIQNLIWIKRGELTDLVGKRGLMDNEVLKCSQELDLLIYQMQLFDS